MCVSGMIAISELSVHSEACVVALCFVSRQEQALIALTSRFPLWCKIRLLFWGVP